MIPAGISYDNLTRYDSVHFIALLDKKKSIHIVPLFFVLGCVFTPSGGVDLEEEDDKKGGGIFSTRMIIKNTFFIFCPLSNNNNNNNNNKTLHFVVSAEPFLEWYAVFFIIIQFSTFSSKESSR